jgi:hypothetical protein
VPPRHRRHAARGRRGAHAAGARGEEGDGRGRARVGRPCGGPDRGGDAGALSARLQRALVAASLHAAFHARCFRHRGPRARALTPVTVSCRRRSASHNPVSTAAAARPRCPRPRTSTGCKAKSALAGQLTHPPVVQAPQCQTCFVLDGFPRTEPQTEQLVAALCHTLTHTRACAGAAVPNGLHFRWLPAHRPASGKARRHARLERPRHRPGAQLQGAGLCARGARDGAARAPGVGAVVPRKVCAAKGARSAGAPLIVVSDRLRRACTFLPVNSVLNGEVPFSFLVGAGRIVHRHLGRQIAMFLHTLAER